MYNKYGYNEISSQWRITETPFDNSVQKAVFPSHCDVVEQVHPQSIKTIGGNIAQSVKTKIFSLSQNAFLKLQSLLFAILRNNK